MKVALGTHYHAGQFGVTAEVKELIVYYLYQVERCSRRYGIYENVSVETDGVLDIQLRIFVLRISAQ